MTLVFATADVLSESLDAIIAGDAMLDINEQWAAGLRPDPLLSLREWSDEHAIISTREGAEPGKYRTDRTPFWREVMECMSVTHPATTVVVRKGTQIGFTKTGTNWLGYIMHHVPGPCMVVQPTVNLAKRYSRQRLAPLIEETPCLDGLVRASRQKDSGNTQLSKEFPGGEVLLTGANSAVELRSFTARFLFFDEVDAYPPSVDEEGDPIALGQKRAETFGIRRKELIGSTPKIRGFSRIDEWFEMGDKRYFFLACPFCDHRQHLVFEQLKWEWGKPETVRYQCVSCRKMIPEHYKTRMLRDGEWRATAKASDPGVVSFDINALYSPVGWLSWKQVAQQWEKAQGKPNLLKVFSNAVLARSYQEVGEAPDWKRLFDRLGPHHLGHAPWGVLFLTAGADLQHDRLEIDVYGWGRNMRSWLVDHIVVHGDPATDKFWEAVDEVLTKTWPHESGHVMRLQRFAIDSSDGRFTNKVYQWSMNKDKKLVMAIKGGPGFNRAQPVNGPTKVAVKMPNGFKMKRAADLYTISVDVFKSETVRWLNSNRPTPEEQKKGAKYPEGYIELPLGLTEEWLQQICAERMVLHKNKRGFEKREWSKTRERNEAFDCRVYARAAAWAEGMDFWHAKRWTKLEAQFPDKKEAPVATQTDVEVAQEKVDHALPLHDPETGEILEETPAKVEEQRMVGVLRQMRRKFKRSSVRSSYMQGGAW